MLSILMVLWSVIVMGSGIHRSVGPIRMYPDTNCSLLTDRHNSEVGNTWEHLFLLLGLVPGRLPACKAKDAKRIASAGIP